jgi:hypothetical protein
VVPPFFGLTRDLDDRPARRGDPVRSQAGGLPETHRRRACEPPRAGSGARWVPHAEQEGPATADKIVAMAPSAGERLSEIRDRALLPIGFAGAFRRSELV